MKEPIILLHGAIGASSQLKPLADLLDNNFKVYLHDFTGHGGRSFPDHGFSMNIFAQDVLHFMEKEHLDKASFFGYSMGGYVGMYLARHNPEKVTRLITLATKYHWDAAIAAKEAQMLSADKIEQKIPSFAETLRQRHAPNDWKEVLKKTADMMTALGNDNTLKQEDHAAITVPSLLLLGDRDKMITQEETAAVYRTLPAGQMGMIPNSQHPIEQTDIGTLAFMVQRFLQQQVP